MARTTSLARIVTRRPSRSRAMTPPTRPCSSTTSERASKPGQRRTLGRFRAAFPTAFMISRPARSPLTRATRGHRWAASRPRLKAPASSPSKGTPRSASASTCEGPSLVMTSTASGSASPAPAAMVSSAWASGVSPGPRAAAIPPWAQMLDPPPPGSSAVTIRLGRSRP